MNRPCDDTVEVSTTALVPTGKEIVATVGQKFTGVNGIKTSFKSILMTFLFDFRLMRLV